MPKLLLIVASTALSLAIAASASTPRKASAAWTSGSLEGVWTNASYTQFERPSDAQHLVPTPQEAKALSARLASTKGVDIPADKDVLGQVDSEYSEAGTGLARIRGQLRTSWIVSPADGQVAYTEEGKRRFRFGKYRPPSRFDNPEDRSASERCLFSNSSAPPQMSTQDSNLFTIVQTKTQIALTSEKNHDVRIVTLGQRPPHEPPSWSGNSYGRWEGRTLVVETEGFRDAAVDRFWMVYSSAAHVTERFTRTAPDEIAYEFLIVDPEVLVEPVRGEMVFTKSAGRPFEFTCHEGNYSLPSILRAARLGRQEAAAKRTAAVPPPP